MGKLTDVQIRAWMKSGERFEGRGDGDGLWLVYRKDYKVPLWRLRYRFANKPRAVSLGSYNHLSIADARRTARELRARVALGYDVASEKRDRKRAALARIEADQQARTVAQLADEYFERNILGRWKHPNIVRSRIERDIKPAIGKLRVEDVRPLHIDAMLKTVKDRGAPTIANDVLRWARRMFDYAVKRHMVEYNPAAAFSLADAGGKELARKRALSRTELETLFKAMAATKGFTIENYLTVRLLLLLGVRKCELIGAKVREFDLDRGEWHLPVERAKTSAAIDIPLVPQAVASIRELIRLGGGDEYLLPARKRQERLLPHIHENTLNVALSKVQREMKDVPPFTIHDFRRTARTHLAGLGVAPHVAERYLNHKIKGIEGIYNRHDYFAERRDAQILWAAFLDACESGQTEKVVPLRRAS